MRPIHFQGVNSTFGEGQKEYQPLPVCFTEPFGQATSCWELTEEDLQKIIASKKIFVCQWTFGNKLQPIRLGTELSEFIVFSEEPQPLPTEQPKHKQTFDEP